MGSPAVHRSLGFYKIALFQITNGANSRFYLSKTSKKYHTFVYFRVISKWTPESDASTETADQVRRLISFPVPLELRFEEITISRKFFLPQFPPNFFSFSPTFFPFWRGQARNQCFNFAGGWKVEGCPIHPHCNGPWDYGFGPWGFCTDRELHIRSV